MQSLSITVAGRSCRFVCMDVGEGAFCGLRDLLDMDEVLLWTGSMLSRSLAC